MRVDPIRKKRLMEAGVSSGPTVLLRGIVVPGGDRFAFFDTLNTNNQNRFGLTALSPRGTLVREDVVKLAGERDG